MVPTKDVAMETVMTMILMIGDVMTGGIDKWRSPPELIENKAANIG